MTDEEKFEKLQMYSTAWSPVLERFVKITGVRKDSKGVPLIDAEFTWEGEVKTFLFREYELERFVL